jgi:hypothetical protein
MKSELRVLFTFFLMIVFFWSWPVRLFTKRNNCYFWTLERLFMEGGRAKWYPSNRWIGYHVIWIDFAGQGWEYTVPRMKKGTPWTRMLFYDGSVRKFRSRVKDQ